MTVCPVAIAVGCKKCPVFALCPLTRVLGDQVKPDASAPDKAADQANKANKPD